MVSIQDTLRGSRAARKYASSVAGQRTGNWWSNMTKTYSGWLIDLIKWKAIEGRFFIGSHLYKETARFFFLLCFKQTCQNWKYIGTPIEIENLINTLEEFRVSYFISSITFITCNWLASWRRRQTWQKVYGLFSKYFSKQKLTLASWKLVRC